MCRYEGCRFILLRALGKVYLTLRKQDLKIVTVWKQKEKKNPLERIQNLGLVVVCFGLGLFFCWVSFLLADAFEMYVFSGLR